MPRPVVWHVPEGVSSCGRECRNGGVEWIGRMRGRAPGWSEDGNAGKERRIGRDFC